MVTIQPEVKTDEGSIDALVAQLAGQECRVEFGTYANGTCWAYVWVNGDREMSGEADGATFAEAIRNAIEVA